MPHRLWFIMSRPSRAKLTKAAALSRLLPDRPHLPIFGDATLLGSRLASSVSSTLDVADGNNRKNPPWQGKACFGRVMSEGLFMGYRCNSAIPRRGCARVVHETFRPEERAWGMPGAQCTRSLVCEVVV